LPLTGRHGSPRLLFSVRAGPFLAHLAHERHEAGRKLLEQLGRVAVNGCCYG